MTLPPPAPAPPSHGIPFLPSRICARAHAPPFPFSFLQNGNHLILLILAPTLRKNAVLRHVVDRSHGALSNIRMCLFDRLSLRAFYNVNQFSCSRPTNQIENTMSCPVAITS